MGGAGGPLALVRDFSQCNARLWADKLGQISLATTTLLWGIFGNLRVIVFAWAAAALGYGTAQASNLAGVVVIGSIAGAVIVPASSGPGSSAWRALRMLRGPSAVKAWPVQEKNGMIFVWHHADGAEPASAWPATCAARTGRTW